MALFSDYHTIPPNHKCLWVRNRLRLPCVFCDWGGTKDDRLQPDLVYFLPFHAQFVDVDLDLP